MTKLIFAATQMTCDWDLQGNIDRAEQLVREAAGQGAQVILLQELFATPYFCKDEMEKHFSLAHNADNNPLLQKFQALAEELEVVLPVSFFESSGNNFFNSLAMIDADGRNLGVYRKSHIPDGPGYSEKFYFSPGNTGFRVWETRYARIGTAICWDQWFPEAARAMALMGAEALLYPTAIGSEPHIEGFDSRDHWQRVMQGHAAANLVRLSLQTVSDPSRVNPVRWIFMVLLLSPTTRAQSWRKPVEMIRLSSRQLSTWRRPGRRG